MAKEWRADQMSRILTVITHEVKYCCLSSNLTITRRRKSLCSDSIPQTEVLVWNKEGADALTWPRVQKPMQQLFETSGIRYLQRERYSRMSTNQSITVEPDRMECSVHRIVTDRDVFAVYSLEIFCFLPRLVERSMLLWTEHRNQYRTKWQSHLSYWPIGLSPCIAPLGDRWFCERRWFLCGISKYRQVESAMRNRLLVIQARQTHQLFDLRVRSSTMVERE